MIKNVIIAVLLLLVIAMPVSYLYYRHTQIMDARAREAGIKPLKYEHKINVANPHQKGYILYGPSDTDPNYAYGHLYIMDMGGRIYVNKKVDGSVYDFRQWRVGNKIIYTYAISETKALQMKVTDGHSVPAHLVILDSALNETGQVHFIPNGGLGAKGGHLDPHDLIVLGEDHFITLANFEKNVTNIPDSLKPSPKVKVYTSVIQEQKGGKVIWQWDASKFPELYSTSIKGNNFSVDTATQDYTHVNVLIMDPKDSNLIVSFRNLHQLIKINRKDGSIMWHLGGKNSDFPQAENQVFYGQHGAIFTDRNTLLFIDNGRSRRPYSRIVEMALDEKNKTITSFKAYKIPHLFIKQQGNVEKIGDKYFLCGGTGRYLLLVDPQTDKYFFEMSANLPSYRAYVVDSVYGLEKRTAEM